MYLKSIKLEGFKSFSDKTIFSLNRGITGIVGPNGSGKSNIVDAVRWVLGEQSVKSLRGSSMSDVIFNGTELKKPLNKASVTLTFDNKDHFLNSEFEELEIKRTIYRSGESEYSINNAKVRYKDIAEILMDSHIGSDAFNIISQGSVQTLVDAKPIERRIVLESAAGVLKYKKRKEESIRKLDRTKDNLQSINLVIDELSISLDPLKEQANVAKKYLEYKSELENIEIGLIAQDITNFNNELKELKIKEEELTKRIDSSVNTKETSELESIKLDLLKVDEEINNKNKKLFTLNEQIADLEAEKRINLERIKYEYSNEQIENNIINLKEEKNSLIKDIELYNNEIDSINNTIKEKEEKLKELECDDKNTLSKRVEYTNEVNGYIKDKLLLENKIDILENNITNNEKVPLSVRSIINNPRLKGIHDTIGNILNIKDEYLTLTDVVLASSSNFIIVNNEDAAKSAINYLKENNLGRATFLPLNIIKGRRLSEDIIERLVEVNGYIGVLSDLVEYPDEYKSIIENQLGNVIVAKDIDSMNLIAKILEYKYRVVSLDGSIIYAGGSISGGNKKANNNLNLRADLEANKNKLLELVNKINNLNSEIDKLNKEYYIISDKLSIVTSELYNLNTIKETKTNLLEELEDKLKIVKNDIEGASNIKDNSLSKKIDNLMEKLNELSILKDKEEVKLNELKDKKTNLYEKEKELESEINKNNSLYRESQNELNGISVNIGKINVKLDNLLLTLNEDYNITYEYALNNYEMVLPENVARSQVHKLRSEIRSLGEVNTGSIAEYERISERYEFLTNQKSDLEASIESLLNIIDDMDNIMKDKFRSTFHKVSDEFSKVFKIMFKGGVGKLELTDPDDYLNTGVDMIINPPGKKINNTHQLSGGEKSLTAICLLFAILNVSPSPFIILDEVEAALDEANVDLFGEYLNNRKNDSQYILITHKKRMMEYTDVLYGITMQEAGISKVVGVKLEGIN